MTNTNNSANGLGTFGGVYTPSILTILGVIMYLRFGWVVGNVGLLGTLIIVTLSNLITFLTSLSVCAIATDRVVRGGGAYYMISRSLGIETGGAVGIPLYFAQALSVALYTIGFAESVVEVFPGLQNYQLYIALVITTGVGILALTSAQIAIKAQFFIMAAIALSLLSFFLGHSVEETHIEMWRSTDRSFWEIFAVFFPAVTGIMAGVNMSGDLKEPTKSLPIGTLAAVGTGYIIYMILPILLAMRANAETLIAQPFIMRQMAFWSPAIALGVWGATLSSAIGSILGAPRVLQALSRDGIFPKSLSFLGQGHGVRDEPRLGTTITLGVAIAAVCMGDLNLIAPVLTMFFLTTYLVLNLSAAIEGFLQSPSFRPSFKVHWSLSLIGALGCIWVMFLINVLATIIAALIVLGIYFYLQQQELTVTWGDARRGIWMALLRSGIYQVDHFEDTKNWRPHILAFSGSPQKHLPLIELADHFNHKGLLTVASIIPQNSLEYPSRRKLERTIRDDLEKRGIQALVRLITAQDYIEGILTLVDTYGIGPLIPNTIVLGETTALYHNNYQQYAKYCNMISKLYSWKRNVVIFKENPLRNFGKRNRIDIWWGGLKANGSLMLLLAYLLRNDSQWRRVRIFLKLVVTDQDAAQAARDNLKQMITHLNIDVFPQVYISEGRSFEQILSSYSAQADLIFLGLAAPQNNFAEYYQQWQQRTQNLPSTVFVLAAPGFPFEEVLSKD
jgi:amino acid transporter